MAVDLAVLHSMWALPKYRLYKTGVRPISPRGGIPFILCNTYEKNYADRYGIYRLYRIMEVEWFAIYFGERPEGVKKSPWGNLWGWAILWTTPGIWICWWSMFQKSLGAVISKGVWDWSSGVPQMRFWYASNCQYPGAGGNQEDSNAPGKERKGTSQVRSCFFELICTGVTPKIKSLKEKYIHLYYW